MKVREFVRGTFSKAIIVNRANAGLNKKKLEVALLITIFDFNDAFRAFL